MNRMPVSMFLPVALLLLPVSCVIAIFSIRAVSAEDVITTDDSPAQYQIAAKSSPDPNGTVNLKRLGVAFHNYYEVLGRLPPAIVIGPDGKTPHSWRVALLRYMDEQELFDEYRMNEPWDSPHNKKLVERMPDVFRHPAADDDSTSSCYFALTGEGTVFDGEKGKQFEEIRDGLSNTILLVEARREIPWTKPEDIPYLANKKIPQLGGFDEDKFQVLSVDGQVRTIFRGVSEKALRSLITIDDGKPSHFSGDVIASSPRAPLSLLSPRQTAESYVAAASTGRVDDAMALAAPGKSPALRKTIESFSEILDLKSLKIDTVHISRKGGIAKALSSPVALTELLPDGGASGRLLFTLERMEGEWLVTDVDIESDRSAAREIEAFRKQHPESVLELPHSDSPITNVRHTGTEAVIDAMSEDGPVPPPEATLADSPESPPVDTTAPRDAEDAMDDYSRKQTPSGAGANVEISMPGSKTLATKGIMVSWSKDGDFVWGYSRSLGKWTKQLIRPPSTSELAPLLSDNVVALQVGRVVYAYSGQTGRWQTIALQRDQNWKEAQISIDADTVIVTVNDDVVTFANSTGRWSSRDGDLTRYAQPTPDAVKRLASLLAELRTDYNRLEQDSIRFAEEHGDQIVTGKRQAGVDSEDLKSALTTIVKVTFEVRQRLQRTELTDFRQRLAAIEKQIEDRERMQDEIIEHRVKELLDPNLKWDPADDASATSRLPATRESTVTESAPAEATAGELEGDWRLESITGPGVTGHEQGLQARVRGTVWTMVRGYDQFACQLVLNPLASPKTIDFIHELGASLSPVVAWRGIYELHGDTLTIVWGSPGGDRPAKFAGSRVVQNWKRIDEPSATAKETARAQERMAHEAVRWATEDPGSFGPSGVEKVAIDRHKLNTSSVALVEAKRDIPWTKPQDISYHADKPIPTLGGWFPGGWLAGMADGSVQFVSFANEEGDIRNMFTINDGKSVTINGTIRYDRGASREK